MAALAVAIDALGAVLEEGINNSKIMNTIDKEISKALGLLVDLILLPFLPLILGAIIQLYMAILGFGADWKAGWKKFEEEGIAGLIKMAIENAWGVLEKWWESLLKWVFSDKPLAKKILDIFSGIADLFLDAIIPGLPVTWRQLFKILFGTQFDAGAKIVFGVWAKWAEGTIQFVLDVLSFIFGEGKTTKNKYVDFTLNLLRMANPIQWVVDIINYMLGNKTNLKKDIDFILNIKKGIVDPLWDTVTKVGGGIIDAAVKWLGPKASGGYIPETGLALLHKGETVTPAGQSGGNTFNFYGYQDDVFIQKVRGVLRPDGSGYVL